MHINGTFLITGAAGWDPNYAKIVGRLFYTVRFGMAARVSGELEGIFGRPPRSMRQYRGLSGDIEFSF